jgi:hypothetical protein
MLLELFFSVKMKELITAELNKEYSDPEEFSIVILKFMPKGLAKEDRERILAYEIRERFGLNKTRAFMKDYRKKIAAKAAPLRLYAATKKKKKAAKQSRKKADK